MKKLVLAGISILAVVFLVLCSQTSVVGYRVVKDSQQSLIKESVSKIDKVKTNLLTLKSLFTNGKPLLGTFGRFYSFMVFINFIILFSDFVIWGMTPLLFWALYCLFWSLIWPITDIGFILHPPHIPEFSFSNTKGNDVST